MAMLPLQLFYVILPFCIASRSNQGGLLSSCVELKNADSKTHCRNFGSGFHSRINSNEYGILKSPVGLDLGAHAAIVPHKCHTPNALVVPPRNTLSVFRHFWRFLRMFTLSTSTPSLSALTFGRSLLASTFGSFLPVLVALLSTCEPILAYLRKNWAFQGEVDNHPIESLVHAASAVLSAELLFRFVVLRLPFYSRLFSATGGYYGLERLHKLLCGVDRYSLIDALAVVIVLGRMGILTMVHHLFSLENWNTAGFLIAPETSKFMGRMTRFLVVTSFLHEAINLLSSVSIENSLDIEHLLSPKTFRSSKISAALIDECKMCLYHMPEFFKGPIGGKSAQYIIGAWLALDSITKALPQGLEWPFFWLNLTVALDSNSAAGLYLAAVQFLCLVLSISAPYTDSLISQNKMAFKINPYFLTTHFWGPVANWGFVVAGLSEMRKDPQRISGRMTGVLCFYSMLFMRFALAVQPRNLLLFSCHFCNSSVQGIQLYRLYRYRKGLESEAQKALAA